MNSTSLVPDTCTSKNCCPLFVNCNRTFGCRTKSQRDGVNNKLKHLIILLIFLSTLQYLYYKNSTKISSSSSCNTIIEEQDEAVYEQAKNMKYILFWSKQSFLWTNTNGREAFLKNKCDFNNCFLTDNKDIFGNGLRYFDALLFFGPYLEHENLPKIRYTHQKYVYMNPESASNYPECSTQFNGYFNWTATYRLNSDCQIRYVIVKDMSGEIVAPKIQTNWRRGRRKISLQILKEIKTKTKAAAWFVSHCLTSSRREVFVEQLQKELQKYGLEVDVFGNCGNFSCAKNDTRCGSILKRDYFFYLAFENSYAEDYVTEKVLHGFNNTVVPIVYGGANYSRFLPPHSYIDASNISAAMLASKMNEIIGDWRRYSEFFWWRSYYKMYDDESNDFAEASCELCALLHDKARVNKHMYQDFQNWWSPNHKYDCGISKL